MGGCADTPAFIVWSTIQKCLLLDYLNKYETNFFGIVKVKRPDNYYKEKSLMIFEEVLNRFKTIDIIKRKAIKLMEETLIFNRGKKQNDLQWSDKKRQKLELRILSLRNDQIAALLNLVGLEFSRDDIEYVVRDITENKKNSGRLLTLITEADSKENLLWWIDYFEKVNKNFK